MIVIIYLLSYYTYTDIMCLQNALEDSNKSLQPDCYKMLTTRMEMFKNAAKVCKEYPFVFLMYIFSTLIIQDNCASCLYFCS